MARIPHVRSGASSPSLRADIYNLELCVSSFSHAAREPMAGWKGRFWAPGTQSAPFAFILQ